ncbi:hypothetical protein [Prosthecobacter vanneervenii]|uniref:Uncharacterized protein n=1 Tax=Prosthecobacter vanneervenii TaxID=48466 RepID=A0A7W7Y7X1_9BACT|nr:hypothetical protein [Prosthecobacter vanneervenii]MBB5031268.1 hypothetical protein [Prosthecobacter vanneervenii]
MRRGLTASLISVLCCASLHAESLVIPVAGQGWQVTFDGPVPAMENLMPNEHGLEYRCSDGRFSLVVVVEPPAASGGDSVACRDDVWAQARQNAQIQQASVQQWSAPGCECVEYLTADAGKDDKSVQANLICCLAYRGKWIHLQASVTAAKDEDRSMLKHLAQSLSCGPFTEWKGGRRQFIFGDLGRLQIEIPSGWWVGNMSTAKGLGLPEQWTVSLFSASDPNKSWMMTFFHSTARYTTMEDIRRTAENAQQKAVIRSVEGAMNLQEIKLAKGVGCQASYTDAFMVGKPVEVGLPRVSASAFVAPLPDILGTISIMADDVKDPYFQAAIKALDTLEWEPAKAE